MNRYTIAIYAEADESVMDMIVSTLSYRNVRVVAIECAPSSVESVDRYLVDIAAENPNIENVIRQVEKWAFILRVVECDKGAIDAEMEMKILENYIN